MDIHLPPKRRNLMHEITTDQSIPPVQNIVSTEPGQEDDVRKTDGIPAQNVVSTEPEPALTSVHWSWGDLLLIFFVSIGFFLVGAVILAVILAAVLRNAALYVASVLLLEAVALVG